MCQNCIANYGGDNTTKIYWFTIDFIDIKHVSCKPEHCLIRANKKYKGYCATCFQNLFPLDPLTLQIRSKTKEIAVKDFNMINLYTLRIAIVLYVEGDRSS